MTATLDAATTTARLQQWLTANVEGWTDVAVAPIDVQHGSGWSAEIIFVDVSYKDANGPQIRTLVVRRQQLGSFELVLGGYLLLQRQMMAARDARGDFPGPAWIGMEQDPSILGAPFLVMGKVDGRAATQKPNYNVEGWLVDLSPEERGDVWRNAIHAFAKLHQIGRASCRERVCQYV